MRVGTELRFVLGLLVAVQAATALGGIAAVDRMTSATPETARRVADTARWALALLALLGFAVTGIAILRIRSRLLAPLHELTVVLTAYRRGERFRRCARFPSTPLADAISTVNGLLDARSHGGSGEEGEHEATSRARTALTGLLDRTGDPLVVWDPGEESGGGRLVAASTAAHERLAERDDALDAIRRGEVDPSDRFEDDAGPLLLYRL